MMFSPLDLRDVVEYVENNIGTFHTKRLQKIENLKLSTLLRRKNPYLFRTKYILTAEGLVRTVLDAYLSSQEETLFGDFLEGVAVFLCGKVFDGKKPSHFDLEGIDLIFENNEKLYIVEIKSGPYWGNSSQIKKMKLNFENARLKLKALRPDVEIIAVNGCCYGVEPNPTQDGSYWKLCGQDFWRFISNDDELYVKIIEPLGHQAKVRNEAFDQAYAMIINQFTLQFGNEFCLPNGMIDWEHLVRWVSERRNGSLFPLE